MRDLVENGPEGTPDVRSGYGNKWVEPLLILAACCLTGAIIMQFVGLIFSGYTWITGIKLGAIVAFAIGALRAVRNDR